VFSVSCSYHVYVVVAIKASIVLIFYAVAILLKCVSLFFPSLLGNLARCGTLLNLRTTEWRKAKQNIVIRVFSSVRKEKFFEMSSYIGIEEFARRILVYVLFLS
jgi:hypothetical protein